MDNYDLVNRMSVEKKRKYRGVEVTIVIPQELYEKLDEIKKRYGIHYSEFIRNAIVEKLNQFDHHNSDHKQ